jgi:aspartyl-tRNA(Asn)/glutamyl-tRNA(Gln) amidotransferase subunit B
MNAHGDKVTPVVGMEIHVELDTATKMFCRCRNSFGDPPNTNVCPVCIGMPGVLPVMNRSAVEYALRVAEALGCKVAALSKWDRKNYYYPDLPKNYQISQYDLPLGLDGALEVQLPDGATRKIGVIRAHLEEDAGKNVHDFPALTAVDLNRAGVPLLEIVSQPDMHGVDEVLAYAQGMHRLVRWLGVSQANMQMGHMRFEPNINLHVERGGKLYKTPIVEVKNLNSFRALRNTVAHEIDRQYEQWLADPEGFSIDRLGKQNRGYDDATERTVFQREKEEAHDYRYLPDPDLVPVVVSQEWKARLAASVGELPLARRRRFVDHLKLTLKEADALTQDPATGDLLDQAVAAGADAKRCANLLLGKGAAVANERACAIAEIGLSAGQLAELARMLADGKINATAAEKVFLLMLDGGEPPARLAAAHGLLAVTDSSAIEAWVAKAIADNPQAVGDVQSGGKNLKKALGFLTGQAMQMSKGAAPPAEVQRLLREKLGL